MTVADELLKLWNLETNAEYDRVRKYLNTFPGQAALGQAVQARCQLNAQNLRAAMMDPYIVTDEDDGVSLGGYDPFKEYMKRAEGVDKVYTPPEPPTPVLSPEEEKERLWNLVVQASK